jgi:hypothetical protein
MWISGQGAAVVILIAVVFALYRLFVDQAIPAATKIADRHLNQFDRLITAHEKSNEKISSGFQMIDKRLDSIDRASKTKEES